MQDSGSAVCAPVVRRWWGPTRTGARDDELDSSLIRARSRCSSNLVNKLLMLEFMSGPEWTTLEPRLSNGASVHLLGLTPVEERSGR